MRRFLFIVLLFTFSQGYGQSKFGYSTIPPESVAFSLGSANNATFTKVNLPTPQTISDIGVYIGSTTANAYGIIYNDDGDDLGTLVAFSGPQALNINSVNTFLLTTPVVLAAGDYWIGIQADQNSVILGRTNATGNDIRFFNSTFGSFPNNPVNTLLSDVRTPSIWLTGTTLIPTLSQWGLIILGLCLSITGFVAVRRKIYSPA